MSFKQTNGKCGFGFETIEVENGKCMDALNMTIYEDNKDKWNPKCINCPLFGRKKENTQDITEALQQKGIIGEDYYE